MKHLFVWFLRPPESPVAPCAPWSLRSESSSQRPSTSGQTNKSGRLPSVRIMRPRTVVIASRGAAEINRISGLVIYSGRVQCRRSRGRNPRLVYSDSATHPWTRHRRVRGIHRQPPSRTKKLPWRPRFAQTSRFVRQRWRDQGYFLNMRYIGLERVEQKIERIATRAAAGGHSAPAAKIRMVWKASLDKLPRALREFERVRIYDNSGISGRRYVLETTEDESRRWLRNAKRCAGLNGTLSSTPYALTTSLRDHLPQPTERDSTRRERWSQKLAAHDRKNWLRSGILERDAGRLLSRCRTRCQDTGQHQQAFVRQGSYALLELRSGNLSGIKLRNKLN